MSHPTIHDDDVARLTLSAARHELLHEITSSPAPTSLRSRTRRPRWVPAVSAAAVVAVLAVPAYYLSGGRGPDRAGSPATSAPTSPTPTRTATPTPTGPVPAPSVPGGAYIALNAGWQVEHIASDSPTADGGAGYVEISYTQSGRRLEITTYPAADQDSYRRDRQEISAPTATTLLGQSATMWAYDATDHTTIRAPQGASFVEVRGSGMDLAAYRGLLARLVQTDAKGFASSLPADVVTPFNRTEGVTALLTGVTTPPDFTVADVKMVGFNGPYQAATRVAGAVGCAWLTRYDDQPDARREVLAAFDGSRQWPLLERIADQGGYSDEFWKVASRLRSGAPVADLRDAICS